MVKFDFELYFDSGLGSLKLSFADTNLVKWFTENHVIPGDGKSTMIWLHVPQMGVHYPYSADDMPYEAIQDKVSNFISNVWKVFTAIGYIILV